ncbi:PulJ/GspJ family protein [Methylobacterium sp. Leaf118]|uniref:PulJ/GspJ family protein n=1 Tax=Methylobacterium sp. Leaf118 TaxID=2876562 RepID=UPI001E4B5297|nr:prepilin-type cleavage/methylation domain-containing protein [Methylobacterium sp. Leaf118]
MTAAGARPPRGRRGGFLMVEALAVLAISAAILLGLGSLARLMLRQADALAERTARLERVEQGLSALSRDIRRLARARWDGPDRERFVFAGAPTQLLFALDRPAADSPANSPADSPADSPLRETVAVLLQSHSDGTTGRLTRAEAPLPPGLTGPGALAFGSEQVLYEGPARIRFAYVAAPTATRPELIVDVWPASGPPPVAVRLGLADPATGDVASALRVPILTEAEPGCVRARTHYCSRTNEGGAEDDAPASPEAATPAGADGRRRE